MHNTVLFQEVRVRQRDDLDARLFSSLLHEHLHMPPITESDVPAHIKTCLFSSASAVWSNHLAGICLPLSLSVELQPD